MGASIALDLALGRPQLVDRMVLVAPGLPGWKWGRWHGAFDAAESAALEQGDLDEASWLNVRVWLDGPFRSPDQVDGALRRRVYQMQRRAFELDNPKAQSAWWVPDRQQKLSDIAAPTLIAVGELDQPDFAAIGRHIAEQLPNARLELLPGVAHLPPMEAPEAFAALVLGHLAG